MKMSSTSRKRTHQQAAASSSSNNSPTPSPKPAFSTYKMKIQPLVDHLCVYDFQLRDHLRTTNNIYLKNVACTCTHAHNKIACPFTETGYCSKCGTSNPMYLNYKSLLFHQNLADLKLATCCVHIHTPPCGVCINCRTIPPTTTEQPGGCGSSSSNGFQRKPCIIQEPFECIHTTDAVCRQYHADTNGPKFVKTVPHIEILSEHLYNVRNPLFFICTVHAHKHRVPAEAAATATVVDNERYSNAMRYFIESTVCYIQTYRCCANAVFVTKYNSSFVLTLVENNPKKRNTGMNKLSSAGGGGLFTTRNNTNAATTRRRRRCQPPQQPDGCDETTTATTTTFNMRTALQHLKLQKYIIFDPQLWREQSKNHFISLLRAIINMPDKVKDRHQRFESSNFVISNIKRYKSGKRSVIRDSIIGFDTKGIYQTSTISCTLHYSTVLLPQSLYDLLAPDYDLQYVTLKRDPSLKQTCLFVCRAERNPDADVDTVVIPDAIAKPLNQDQDGDKNGVYLLPLRVNGYDRRHSVQHKLAKMELSEAYCKLLTTDGTPRLSFSENNLIVMNTHADELLDNTQLFKRTYPNAKQFVLESNRDVRDQARYMIEVGCGYRQADFDEFCRRLIEINRRPSSVFTITADDLLFYTKTIATIISSGAKGYKESMMMLVDNIRKTDTLFEKRNEMIDQLHRYIVSSKELRHSGREGFSLHYAAHDIIVMLGHVYLNKYHIADYNDFASIGTFLFGEASLDAFVNDLESL